MDQAFLVALNGAMMDLAASGGRKEGLGKATRKWINYDHSHSCIAHSFLCL